jgi:hypothetical protein
VAAESDVLLAYWQEQRAQARHAEEQRSTLTNLILVIAAAALGFLSQWGWETRTLAITVPLVLLGVFGAVASAKLYERNLYHYEQAAAFSRELGRATGVVEHEKFLRDVRERFAGLHPAMGRVRLYVLWITLHAMIAVLGLGLSIALLVTT